jgi:iron complex outermembrane receptor protein
VDAAVLDQSPASPHPREGSALSPLVPLDANHNPADAFLNRRRYGAVLGYERPAGEARWSTTLSYARTTSDALRGFLTSAAERAPNAIGFTQQIGINELYFDSHLEWTRSPRVRLVAGVDFVHGNGESTGQVFDYVIPLDGRNPPPAEPEGAEQRAADDRREFLGGYGFAEWNPSPRWRIEGGLRLNVTNEAREGEAGAEEPGAAEPTRTDVRPSGSLGVVWTAWSGGLDSVRLFAGCRNTFKPAVFDFGLGEGEQAEGLLEPETAQSYELGARGRLAGGRLAVELAGFWMDFSNLVVATSVNGLPALRNAGHERFKGVEASLRWRLRDGLTLRGAASYHDSRFRDFVRDFDGGPTQLAGNRLEMSPHVQASGGALWARERGPLGQLSVQYVGSRFLNMRNTALVSGYTTVSAGVGWRRKRWELRVDGKNLGDRRPPVSESELGDAQYYRLPARQLVASLNLRF